MDSSKETSQSQSSNEVVVFDLLHSGHVSMLEEYWKGIHEKDYWDV